MGEDGGVPDPYAPPKPAAGQPPRPPAPAPRPPRPARPPRSPGGDPLAAESRLAWYTGLGALLLTVPSAPAGAALGVAAAVLGVRARRRARRDGRTAPGALAGLLAGLLAASLAAGQLAAYRFLPPVRQYVECLAGANTELAKQDCQRQLRSVSWPQLPRR